MKDGFGSPTAEKVQAANLTNNRSLCVSLKAHTDRTRVEQKNRYAKYSFSDGWRSNRLKTEKTT